MALDTSRLPGPKARGVAVALALALSWQDRVRCGLCP
jgi:hypothetical protein